MNIGDRVKFMTMGGWYNSGIIKDMDKDSYLIEVDELGCKPPKDVHIQLPYYAKVLSCEMIAESEEREVSQEEDNVYREKICEDKKMTNQEAIKELEYVKKQTGYADIALDMAIKALETQPCEDCISREDAIKETKALFLRNFDIEYVVEILKTLPSVTPTIPKGKWIDIGIVMEGRKYKNHECDMVDAYYCDYCGYNQYIKTNYCPNCGAKMEVDE